CATPNSAGTPASSAPPPAAGSCTTANALPANKVNSPRTGARGHRAPICAARDSKSLRFAKSFLHPYCLAGQIRARCPRAPVRGEFWPLGKLGKLSVTMAQHGRFGMCALCRCCREALRFDRFRPFGGCQDSCQIGRKVRKMLARTLDASTRDGYDYVNEPQQRQEVMPTHSRVPWTERRPPSLISGSSRGRGSSPARFATVLPQPDCQRVGARFIVLPPCFQEG